MNPQEAQLALQDIHARSQQVVRKARLPWWHPVGEAICIFALGAAGDLDPDGDGVGFEVVWGAYILLQLALDEAAERRMGIRLRRTARTTALNIAYILLMLTVLIVGAWGFNQLDVPLPATLTGACLAALTLLLAKPMHRARQASLRR
ncbi:hypothetical protein [Actinomadura rudentiformis]|uniref:Uncharacterized protein n=1 Tax=Actinomadura rudentiformis TaxID=359158 RepID=A0A6H9Z897_9ACTN|nr:hypothetical protein [Actinomadura rudentiformis]KAB2350156.1 hypothetical protein F8566_10185 [Actinomadura rudentiformis]